MTRISRSEAAKLGIIGQWPKAPKEPSDGMNGLERAFFERLCAAKEHHTFQAVWREPVKLRLAGRTWYTPDFLSLSSLGQFTFWETKGFLRDDASVKIKVAAESYPCFRFVLVQKDRGRWRCIDVTTRGFSPQPYTPEWLP